MKHVKKFENDDAFWNSMNKELKDSMADLPDETPFTDSLTHLYMLCRQMDYKPKLKYYLDQMNKIIDDVLKLEKEYITKNKKV